MAHAVFLDDLRCLGLRRGRIASEEGVRDRRDDKSRRVRSYRAPTRLHTTSSAFRGVDLKKLPDAEVFYAYTHAPGWVIDSAVARGVRGIVMDGYGAGVINARERAAVVRAQAKGVVVSGGKRKDSADTGPQRFKDRVRR